MPIKRKNIVSSGDSFGRLKVIEPQSSIRSGAYYCLCICSCGTTKEFSISNLILGKTKSCGCLSREITGNTSRTHGMSASAEYKVWRRMIDRCTNPKVSRYSRYGGRGITVCKSWSAFENFISDMGAMPSKRHSLGRIDNNGNYEPSNCQWETSKQQANNTARNVTIEWNGEVKTYAEWADITGIPYHRIVLRHRAGHHPDVIFNDDEKALSDKPITYNGIEMLTTHWMRKARIPISSFYHHKRKGLTPEQIVSKYMEKMA